jgi:hypothetical protein
VDRAHLGDHLAAGGLFDDAAELMLDHLLMIGFTSATSLEEPRFAAEVFKLR